MVSLIVAEGGKSHVAVQQEPDIQVILCMLLRHTLMADCMWLYVSDGKIPDSKVKQNTMVSVIVAEGGKSQVSVQQEPDIQVIVALAWLEEINWVCLVWPNFFYSNIIHLQLLICT